MDIEGKIIWITGASSGIGAELARQLFVLNTKLILTGRNQQVLEKLKEELKGLEENCAILPADLSRSEEINDLTQKAISFFGTIDIVIHSAGVTQRSYASQTQMEVYRYLMEINFFAPVSLTKALIPLFHQKGNGHIVAISSMAGLMGFPLRTGYAAAKHALKGFFETLQTENDIPGLSITIVSPGRIRTPISLSAMTADGSPHNQMDEGQVHGIPVERCAEKIIQSIKQKKKHVIIARSERLLYWMWWFAKPLYYIIARKKGLQHRTKA